MVLPVPSEMTAIVGQILTAAEWNSNVRDGINFLLNRPLFVGYQTTAESIPNATYTAVALDTTTVDTYSGHSNTVNNVRYTAQVAGWYRCTGIIAYGSNATGQRAAVLWVNGALSSPPSQVAYTSVGGGNTMVLTSMDLYLNVGDYILLVAYQNSGAALSLVGGYSSLQVEWVHA